VPGTTGEKYRQAVADADTADEVVAGVRRQLREDVARIRSEEEWIVQLTGENVKEISPFPSLLAKPKDEGFKIEEHRNALARAKRRKAEAEGQLVEAEKAAAKAKKAVEALVPEVLKA
jgi:hypothetical protein